jgi:hypothetical protein
MKNHYTMKKAENAQRTAKVPRESVHLEMIGADLSRRASSSTISGLHPTKGDRVWLRKPINW